MSSSIQFRSLIFSFLAILPAGLLFAQEPLPLQHSLDMSFRGLYETEGCFFHTGLQPIVRDGLRSCPDEDSALTPGCPKPERRYKWFRRKLFYQDFLQVDSADFRLSANPLLDLSYGYDALSGKSTYMNVRGFMAEGQFRDKVYIRTTYSERQARFPSYVNEFVQYYGVAPGDGRVKEFKGGAWDFGSASALVSISPWKFLNVQIGYDKRFIGFGYRSLLLSDNSSEYPFLQLTGKWKFIQYSTLFASFQNADIQNAIDAPSLWYHGYQKKSATFNYLSFNIARRVEIGLFEGTIWKAGNSSSATWNINHFIPLIYVNTLRYSLFSEKNVLVGLNVKVRIAKKVQLYGQLMIDDLHWQSFKSSGYQKTKWGFQAGMKYFNAFTVKNLHLQLEYNQVRPYSYSHWNPQQSYTNYNQSLAHPLGANFLEGIFYAIYRYKRIFAETRVNYAKTGADPAGWSFGQNIFASDNNAALGYNSNDNQLLQGYRTDIINAHIQAGVLLNPRYNLTVIAGLDYRSMKNSISSSKNLIISFGIKTSLTNHYYDF